MTDPLTPEQRETLREKRRMMEFQLARISDLGPQADNWALDVLIGIRYIFAIIDSLPAPKQYTEAEIRKWAKEKGMSDAFYFAYSGGAVECARFLGAIKGPNA